MTAAEIHRPPPAPLDAVRAEQIRLLYASGGFPVVTTLAVGGLLACLLVWVGTLPAPEAGIWMGVMTLNTGARQGLRIAFQRARPPDAEWRRWADRFVIGTLIGALTWGVGALWLLAPGRVDLQMFVVAVLLAVAYGGMMAFGGYLPAFLASFLPTFIPVVAWFTLQGDVLHIACTVCFLAWIPTVLLLARHYNQGQVQALRLRFENAALVESLTAQKAIAEQASLAKSRFLAAASHDLRQPVHALGLFIGAMRSHRLPKRSAELVDQMDASIGALDGLFTSLLDISRLDAGLIDGKPTVLPVQPMLARICHELEPEAEAKGIDLVIVPTTAYVLSDPILLERVMPNLISNAVRYTESGWVIVGCRRRGRSYCLEVRDTGPGIAPEQREAVFEEFYQIGNPDRDRAKGLGLGLPIVQRLTAILGHPLEMDSEAGQGTTFRVLVPRATARAVAPSAPRRAPVDLRTGTILAIDDEQAIRVAMAALLESWGHRVIAVGGVEEALAAVSGEGAPDLIICDYRLRAGENGVEAVARVRAALGVEVPALLVTGDAAAESIREAEASGYPLLHKPLSHARLRAAVSNLIRRPARLAPAAE
ncbi:hybrid sensor histidine kinase/response regulator [Phenylobacterium sp.]|uniref:ATP-binding response regulator n=1 Tax=Phenylobacterium sp. TaxID=1871053 RepID=UPI0025D36C5F|nr:hybrid sensor histidine kinase/response regulator [Phenylobacterium sp.]